MRPIILITITLALLASCTAHPITPARPSAHPATPATMSTPLSLSTPALPSPTLKPPDSTLPAAGICSTAQDTYAEVLINPDTPAPRCQHIAANQRLRVINHTDHTAEVRLAGHTLTLPPQTEGMIDLPFGDYLAPGVHNLAISTYTGGGATLWLDR
jgi:hypothetical protein